MKFPFDLLSGIMPFCGRGLSDDVCSDQSGLVTLAIFSSELPLATFSSP